MYKNNTRIISYRDNTSHHHASKENYPLLPNMKYDDEGEYFKTKILAYRIETGALCRLVTAYGEPERGHLIGDGKVRPLVEIGTTRLFTPNASTRSQKDNELSLERVESDLVEVGQVVMFLKTWRETESLVLAGREYWIVHDKNLEPIMDNGKIPEIWKAWLSQFMDASVRSNVIRPPCLKQSVRFPENKED